MPAWRQVLHSTVQVNRNEHQHNWAKQSVHRLFSTVNFFFYTLNVFDTCILHNIHFELQEKAHMALKKQYQNVRTITYLRVILCHVIYFMNKDFSHRTTLNKIRSGLWKVIYKIKSEPLLNCKNKPSEPCHCIEYEYWKA